MGLSPALREEIQGPLSATLGICTRHHLPKDSKGV